MNKYIFILMIALAISGCNGDKIESQTEKPIEDIVPYMDDSFFIKYCLENFDINNDAKLSQTEASSIKKIDISEIDMITSIKGIEYFTNLQSFCAYGCSELIDVDLSNNTKLKVLEDKCFMDCDSLETINLPNGLIEIGYKAFYCCDLESITIPDSVTTIGSDAFAYSSLKNIIIPDKVEIIEGSTFHSCDELEFCHIGNSVKTIGSSAFYKCTCLTDITIPDSVETISKFAFYGCTCLTDITISDSVETIGESAFDGCEQLTDIYIGKNVKFIGDAAFARCNYTAITIPENVQTIEEDAFATYTLKEVYCRPMTPPEAAFLNRWDAFNNGPVQPDAPTPSNLSVIYVPYESLSSYISARGWKDYSNIIKGYDF